MSSVQWHGKLFSHRADESPRYYAAADQSGWEAASASGAVVARRFTLAPALARSASAGVGGRAMRSFDFRAVYILCTGTNFHFSLAADCQTRRILRWIWQSSGSVSK